MNKGKKGCLFLSFILFGFLISFIRPAKAQEAGISESTLICVDSKVTVSIDTVRYDRRTQNSIHIATVTNNSSETLPCPIYLMIHSVTPDTIPVLNADGTTTEGHPYYDLCTGGLVPEAGLGPGEVSASIRLEFYNPTRARFTSDLSVFTKIINTHPSDLTVMEHEPATFSITAIGSDLRYQWQQYGVDIPGANQATYTIPEAVYSYNGATFRCVVKNDAGSSTSDVATLTVIDNQPPALTINGPAERTTTDEFAVITGVVTDTGSGMGDVEAISDQYSGQKFGAFVNSAGAYSAEIPLRAGQNQITVSALDVLGNASQKNVKVTLQVAALPSISINTPVNGTTVNEDPITLSGLIRSSLTPDQIRVVFNNTVKFPIGANNEYAFTFENIHLKEGPNSLVVTAETLHGNGTAQATVNYRIVDVDEEEEQVRPIIEVQLPQPEVYIPDDSLMISGLVRSENGLQTITVNGQDAAFVRAGSVFSFDYELLFSDPQQEEIEIVIRATDENGHSSTVTYTVKRDAIAPVIQLTSTGLLIAPDVNAVTKTPYLITGIVTEKNLAGVSINNQIIEVIPAGESDEWSFEAGVALLRGEPRDLIIEAWDMAGNSISREVILSLSSNLDIEVISPGNGEELIASEDPADIAVVIRIPAIAADDQVSVCIDETIETTLTVSGSTAGGTVSIAEADGEHRMEVEVRNSSGEVLAETAITFSIINSENIPLALNRQDPENNAEGVEPNAFIAFYFNKPIDPALLEIEVLETAHGKVYKEAEAGADITKLSKIELVDVHRDQASVSGGISHFPQNTMAAFYPEKDFAYGGTIYVTVLYNNEELSRSSFKVRPLPTFIQGFVADQFMSPLEGIKVELPDLGRKATTDKDGSYGFGFGEPASLAIPPGHYKAVINPELNNRAFGTVARWINVEEGRLNTIGITKIPILNPDEPFRRIMSNQQQAVLAGGELILDLSKATLIFPDGRERGNIHVQFMHMSHLAYSSLPAAMPHWVFAAQPMGIGVAGSVGITLSMPTIYGGHDYVSRIGKRVILLGFNPSALQIMPVGVGCVDVDNKQVINEGEVELEGLDFIGYALVDADNQEILERFANGEISLRHMIGEIEK